MSATYLSSCQTGFLTRLDSQYSRQYQPSREERISLAKMVCVLFDHWKISIATQACLLGLSENSRATITRYHKGEPLADSRDLLDRVANLLAIHANLRTIFPENRDLVYRWPTSPNPHFGGITPVEFMCEYGLIGVAQVRRYLDFESQM